MIKLLDNPSELLKKFNFHTDRGAMAGKNQYAMQQMPRLLLEFLSILALSVLAFSLLSKDPIEGSSASKLGMIAFGNDTHNALSCKSCKLIPIINLWFAVCAGFK